MKAPQIIILCIFAFNLLCEAFAHGKPREGKYNVFYKMIGIAIYISLLCWGGFFG